MASKKPQAESAATGHWAQRFASPDFKHALNAALEAELRHLSKIKLAEIIDPKLVHAIIDDLGPDAIDRGRFSEVLQHGLEAVIDTLHRSDQSAEDLLGAEAGREIETLLLGGGELSDDAEDFVSELMQQDFVQQLFTEIIFTSIVSFNKKVNPIFGGFAMRAMEDQIRGFIRLFMPMVQQQAAAFALDNQTAVRELLRELLRQGLRKPLGEHLQKPSAKRKAAGAALLRDGLQSTALDALARQCAHAVWDAVYAPLRHHALGDLVKLDTHAKAWAARLSEILLPFLSHAPLLTVIKTEAAAASPAQSTAVPPKPRRAARAAQP